MLRRVARNLKWGRTVLEAKSNIKRSWSGFWSVFTQIEPIFLSKLRWSSKKKRSSLRISCFFCPNFGDLKKKKENGLQPGSDPLFLVVITLGPWPLLIANTIGEEASFVFRAKIGLRNAKNGVNAKNRPMGGWSPPCPPPGYATGNARGQGHRRKCLQEIYIYLFKAISKKRSSKIIFRRSPKKNT